MEFSIETPVLCIAFRQETTLDIEGLGSVRLKEGQFFIINGTFRALLQSGRESITLFIQYDSEYWNEWTPWLPPLTPGRITRETHHILYRLLHTASNTPGFELYQQLTARLILFQLLSRQQNESRPSPYTHDEIAALHAARDMIRTNIRRHLSIPEIAKRSGINEFKLKSGFRELFGQGIYGYLQSERMQEGARLLIETRLAIKVIADKTGYKSPTSFIKTFRKTFGTTPGRYRNQQ